MLYLLCGLVAIDALAVIEQAFDAALAIAARDTVRVCADEMGVLFSVESSVVYAFGFEEHKDKRHSDVSAVGRLVEVVRSRVVVHVGVNLVDAWQWVEN